MGKTSNLAILGLLINIYDLDLVNIYGKYSISDSEPLLRLKYAFENI